MSPHTRLRPIPPCAQTDRKLAAELARADDGSQAGRRALDARASELQELQLERAVCAREIEACETGPALTTLDEDALAPLPADPSAAGGAAAAPVDQKQVRLRRLAAELRRRRELQERIGALTAEVGVTRAKRQRLLDARERVHPELDAVLSASAPLRLYLSLSAHAAVSEGGGGGAADARAADLLEPPLHTLHARACVLLGSAQLGSTLVGARIVPCADALAHAAHAWPAVLRPSERCVCLELLCSRAQLSLVFSYHPAVHLLAVTAVQGKGGVRAAELLGAIDHDDDGQTFPHCRALLAASRGARARAPAVVASRRARAPPTGAHADAPRPRRDARGRWRRAGARAPPPARRRVQVGAVARRHRARRRLLPRRQRGRCAPPAGCHPRAVGARRLTL